MCRARRRHHNERIIKKRMNIIKNIWKESEKDNSGPDSYLHHENKEQFSLEQSYRNKLGMLRKHNLSCGCFICKSHKWLGLPTIRELKQNEKDKTDIV